MINLKYFIGFVSLISFFFSFNSSTKNGYQSPSKAIQNKTELQKSMENGKEIYTDFCIQCHMANGKGDLKNFPPLDGSDWLSKKINQSIHAVKYGQTGEIIVKDKKFNNTMPSMGLSNQEIADVMNYIRNSWSNKQSKMISVKQVEAVTQ